MICLITAAACCMACCWEDDINLPEEVTSYRQVSYVYADSTETEEKYDSSLNEPTISAESLIISGNAVVNVIAPANNNP